MSPDATDAERPQIAIVGGGFGGAYCAQHLHRLLRRDEADITLLDRQNYFLFTPLLLEAGTGGLEPRHAIVPIRAFLRGARFVMAEVTDIDPDKRVVRFHVPGPDGDSSVDPPRQMTYDHLVLAPGSITRMPNVAGLKRYGFQIKSLADAVALRDRLITLLEIAEATEDVDERRTLLHIVVVGGNFTGAEVAGEFDMLLRTASRQYPSISRSDIRVTLVELQGRILGPLGRELSDYAAQHLRSRGVDIRLETTVDRVADDHVILSTGETLPTRTVVWCAGIEPSSLIRRMELPKDERGYVLCDRDLRVKGYDRLWSIGDCAVNFDAEGKPYPATAQHAVGQGKHLAKNLVAVLRGQATTPCDIRSKGTLAALGCRTGVAEIFGVKLSGFAAWWMWRTVYLLKMPTLARKMRVALDWTIDLIFSRDYVQLGVHQRATQQVAEDDDASLQNAPGEHQSKNKDADAAGTRP